MVNRAQVRYPLSQIPPSLSGRRPLHLANARSFGRSKAPLGLLLLRKRGLSEKYRTARKASGHLSGQRPSIMLTQDRSVAQKPHWGFCCCANASLPMAGGTGSSCPQQRKTERSRRGAPCCTYRYCLWLLAGCVRVVAPCFFTMLHRFLRAASGIRHQHGSESDAAHPGIVPIFCAGMPCKLARKQCHFPAYCPILSA